MFAALIGFVRIQGDIKMYGRADDKIKAMEGIDLPWEVSSKILRTRVRKEWWDFVQWFLYKCVLCLLSIQTGMKTILPKYLEYLKIRREKRVYLHQIIRIWTLEHLPCHPILITLFHWRAPGNFSWKLLSRLSDVGIEVAIVSCKKWKDHPFNAKPFWEPPKLDVSQLESRLDLYDHTNPAPIIFGVWRKRKQRKSGWGGGDGERLSGQTEDLQLHAPRVMFFFSIPMIWEKKHGIWQHAPSLEVAAPLFQPTARPQWKGVV